MANDPIPPLSAPVIAQWKPDKVFSVLAEPARRAILRSLATGTPKSASQLRGATGLRLDATLKHLSAMRSAGLLVTTPDSVDGRRMLYSLSPSVPVVKTPEGAAIDFGFCLLRFTMIS
jgi:DNA-binding transcriptional ArsR family regulator